MRRRLGRLSRARRRVARFRPNAESIKRVAPYLALVAIGAVLVCGLDRVDISTSATSFLPSGDPSVAAVQREASQFGGDPVVVLLTTAKPDALLQDSTSLTSLLGAEGHLSKLPNVASVYGPATLLNQIALAAQTFIDTLAGRRAGLENVAEQAAQKAGESQSQIDAAGQEADESFDQYYAPLLVKALPAGVPTLSNLSFVKAVVYQPNGQPRPEWHFVVPSTTTVAILIEPSHLLDQHATGSLVRAVRADITAAKLPVSRVTVTGVPVVIGSLGSEVEHEVPLIGGLVGAMLILRFLAVPLGLSRRRRLLPLVTTLIGTAAVLAGFGWLGWPLSFAAAAVLPLFLGIGSSFPLYLGALVNRRRVLTMSVASAAGFASLAVSPLPVVRELGLALAAGVLLTVVASLAAAHLPFIRANDRDPDGPVRPARRSDQPALQRHWRPLLRRNRALPVLALLAVTAGAGWYALSTFTVQADPETLAQGLPALSTATYAQQVIGYSGEIDIVLQGSNVLSPQALAWQRQAESDIEAHSGSQVRSVLTVPDLLAFLGSAPTAAQITAGSQLLPAYLTTAVVTPSTNETVMVFGAKLAALDPGALSRLRHTVPPPPSGYRASVVGLPVAAARGYQLISAGRYLENLTGIAAAGLVLALGLRRRGDAARAILASLLAAGWGMVCLWVIGWSLNPLTATLGSLTAVASGEFVVLLTEAKHRRLPWLRRSVAVAGLTTALGYSALLTSQLELLRQFGLVLAGSVVLAYFAAVAVVRLLPPSSTRSKAPAVRRTSKKVMANA